jgi:hypothetical protein
MDCNRNIIVKGTENLHVRYLGDDNGSSIYEVFPCQFIFHKIIFQKHVFESLGRIGYILIEVEDAQYWALNPYTGRPFTSVNTFANVLPDFYPGLASPYQLTKLLKGRGHAQDVTNFLRQRWPSVVSFLRRQEEIQINKRLDDMIKRYGLYEEKNP